MYFQLFTESLRFAWLAIVNNRLRTFLSLLGVTIGIVAIISVFTIVDALEKVALGRGGRIPMVEIL